MKEFKQELQNMVVRMKRFSKLIKKESDILKEETTKIHIFPPNTKYLKLLHEIILKFHYQILNSEIPYKSFNYCELRKDEWKTLQKLCKEIGLKTQIVEIPYDQDGVEEILTIELL